MRRHGRRFGVAGRDGDDRRGRRDHARQRDEHGGCVCRQRDHRPRPHPLGHDDERRAGGPATDPTCRAATARTRRRAPGRQDLGGGRAGARDPELHHDSAQLFAGRSTSPAATCAERSSRRASSASRRSPTTGGVTTDQRRRRRRVALEPDHRHHHRAPGDRRHTDRRARRDTDGDRDRLATTEAKMGASGGKVDIAPAVAVTLSNVTTSVRSAPTAPLTLTGSFSATATQTASGRRPRPGCRLRRLERPRSASPSR